MTRDRCQETERDPPPGRGQGTGLGLQGGGGATVGPGVVEGDTPDQDPGLDHAQDHKTDTDFTLEVECSLSSGKSFQ